MSSLEKLKRTIERRKLIPIPLDPAVLKRLRARVSKCAQGPGVYRWLDADGKVLYVGKAKNLRNRLRNYVQPTPDASLGPWKLALIGLIADFDVTVTSTELEALILETNLIKHLRPKYNVLMKDDKNYVYIRVAVQDPFPRIDVVRQMAKDGAKYFGPKTSGDEARRTLEFLRGMFPFRTCKMDIVVNEKMRGDRHELRDASGEREAGSSKLTAIPLVICKNKDRATPCLDHHIGQCSAPCIGLREPSAYWAECIEGVLQFLKGNHGFVRQTLEARMKAAAQDKKFELAGSLRDQLKTLDALQGKQLVSDTSQEDADIIGVALLSGRVQVVIFQERGGKMIGEEHFSLMGASDSVADVLGQFLPQYYSDAAEVVPLIVVGEDFPERATLAQWLSEQQNRKVEIHVPERGKKSKLLELAEKNAEQKAKQAEAKWESEQRNTVGALEELKTALLLPEVPRRIEGYDISHLGGTETVGSMVVFKGGKAANDQYRSFTIHSMKSGIVDDYRSISEVLTRRLRHINGGMKREEVLWKARGVALGKVRKAEMAEVGEKCSLEDAECLVARKEEKVVGIACVRTHASGLQELSGMWVEPQFTKDKLHHLLIRRLLKGIEKKIYAVIDPSVESEYGVLGFRYVLKTPPALEASVQRAQGELAGDPMVVMYDPDQHRDDTSLSSVPDLLVIDGGKGQLGVVVDVLKDMDLSIPVIGLAKREEEVFVPGNPVPVPIPETARFLLMRLRDEAHRSANHHRSKRIRAHSKESFLDTIAGIGPETRMALLKKFGSATAVAQATEEELKEILTDEQLSALKEALK